MGCFEGFEKERREGVILEFVLVRSRFRRPRKRESGFVKTNMTRYNNLMRGEFIALVTAV